VHVNRWNARNNLRSGNRCGDPSTATRCGAKATLRHIRIHDLRHTFASLLLQQGESAVYVKEQLGHSSIQITVDTYGHLIPGANRGAVHRLDDDGATQPSATQAQPEAVDDDVASRTVMIC
jgi:integrase